MKKSGWKIFWGVAFILAAVFLVLDALGITLPFAWVLGRVSLFTLIVGLILVAFIVSRVMRGKFVSVIFPLAFLFMLFEENIAQALGLAHSNIINNWLLLLVALLLTIGLSILLPKRHKYEIHLGNSSKNSKTDGSFGASTIYIDAEGFEQRVIECDFGSRTVYFTNPEAYRGGGTLIIDNSFGAMVIHVPVAWRADVDIDNSFGSVTSPSVGPGGPILYIKGDNSFGAVTVKYV